MIYVTKKIWFRNDKSMYINVQAKVEKLFLTKYSLRRFLEINEGESSRGDRSSSSQK